MELGHRAQFVSYAFLFWITMMYLPVPMTLVNISYKDAYNAEPLPGYLTTHHQKPKSNPNIKTPTNPEYIVDTSKQFHW